MKINNLKIRLHFFILISLLAAPLVTVNKYSAIYANNSERELTPQEVTAICNYIDNFLNPTKDQNKPFVKWAEELERLLVNIENNRIKDFLVSLQRLKNKPTRSPVEVAKEFEKFKDALPIKIRTFMESKKLNKLQILAIISKRVK